MREIVHIQAGQCGNQIGAKVSVNFTCSQGFWDPVNAVLNSDRDRIVCFLTSRPCGTALGPDPGGPDSSTSSSQAKKPIIISILAMK